MGTTDKDYDYFPLLVVKTADLVDPTGTLSNIYIKMESMFNYAFVCGIGVFINQFVIHKLIGDMGLFWANNVAIVTAFIWNYTFSVGPFGFVFGFSRAQEEDLP